MNAMLRRLNLTTHVVSSVGWLGAVAAFLALSIAGRASTSADIVRASYIAMNLLGQFIIVPMSILALATGLVQSLGTQWGLFRYYWVLMKFALTVGATLLLLLHQFTAVAGAARAVSAAALASIPDVGRLSTQLVFDAAFAAVVLVVTTALSVYKPWGLIRPAQTHTNEAVAARMPATARVSLVIIGLIAATIIALHLAGHGLGGHGM